MNVLLDTNILVDLLNGHEQARTYLRSLKQLNISTITVYEVLAGCFGARSSQLKTAEILINNCNVIPVSLSVAKRASDYQRRRNQKRKMADFLIEATAKEQYLVLATRNPKDFNHVETNVPYQL